MSGEPNFVHPEIGFPIGVALVLLLDLFILYNQFVIFGGGVMMKIEVMKMNKKKI